jgi:hypothetical protein
VNSGEAIEVLRSMLCDAGVDLDDPAAEDVPRAWEGEYDHMGQLACNFIFEPERELQSVAEKNLWSFEYALDEFYSRAEALDGFRQVIALRCKPRRLRVEIGAV